MSRPRTHDHDLIRVMLNEGGLTPQAIAAELGCDPRTVKYATDEKYRQQRIKDVTDRQKRKRGTV